MTRHRRPPPLETPGAVSGDAIAALYSLDVTHQNEVVNGGQTEWTDLTVKKYSALHSDSSWKLTVLFSATHSHMVAQYTSLFHSMNLFGDDPLDFHWKLRRTNLEKHKAFQHEFLHTVTLCHSQPQHSLELMTWSGWKSIVRVSFM